MPDILTFRLYAPLAAMGGVAVGEQRDGWTRPGRSALLGLMAACLGVDRLEESAHQALESGYRLAQLMEHAGGALVDYHTAQMPSARRGKTYRTRREELADKRMLNTVLTRRTYRSDLLAFTAVVAKGNPRWSLEAIAAAMERPRFVPYLGRKSCPIGLPLAPRIVEAADVVQALLARRAEPAESALRERVLNQRRPAAPPVIALEPEDAGGYAEHQIRVERRRDVVASRRRWQFALRFETLISLPEGAPCS